MSSYHHPYREWSWFWLLWTLGPDSHPWACWEWHWSFPHLHTGSRQWSQHGMISLPLLCRNAGCCDGPQAWRCNQSMTALWWGQCLWLKLCGKKTESQEMIQILPQYQIHMTIQCLLFPRNCYFFMNNDYIHKWNATTFLCYLAECNRWPWAPDWHLHSFVQE